MLTLEDCIALSELTEEEIDAIAKHDHLPEIIAAELGCCLVRTAAGCRSIAAMIGDDITQAQSHGDRTRAAKLKLVLRQFIAEHCQGEYRQGKKPPGAGNIARPR